MDQLGVGHWHPGTVRSSSPTPGLSSSGADVGSKSTPEPGRGTQEHSQKQDPGEPQLLVGSNMLSSERPVSLSLEGRPARSLAFRGDLVRRW